MPSQFGSQQRPEVFGVAEAANPSEPFVHLFAGLGELLAGRSSPQQEVSFATEAAKVRKAQKVKRVGLAATATGVIPLVPTEADGSRLLRVQGQAEFGKPLPEHYFDPAGGLLVLDHADEVVGIAHQMALTLYVGFETFLEPHVEYVVQEDVGQHGTEVAALRGSPICSYPLACLHVTGFKETPDEQKQTAVFDANLKERHHPVMRDVIEEAFNVGFDNMIDRFEHDRIVESLERLVATPLWPETIRKVHEVGLINALQYPGNRFLDDLIFQGGQTKRATLAVALGDVHPFGGQRLILLSLESRHQIREILVKVLAPLMPAYSVDATGLLLAERLVAPP